MAKGAVKERFTFLTFLYDLGSLRCTMLKNNFGLVGILGFLTLAFWEVAYGGVIHDLPKIPVFQKFHSQLIRHPFTKVLKTGKVTPLQIAVFLNDRIHILRAMERGLPDELKTNDFLVRSHVYEQELLLLGYQNNIPLSEPARDYIKYLKYQKKEITLLHLYLFLTGETGGGRWIAAMINNHFKNVGTLFVDFFALDHEIVKQLHALWIEANLPRASLAGYEQEVEISLRIEVARFDALMNLK